MYYNLNNSKAVPALLLSKHHLYALAWGSGGKAACMFNLSNEKRWVVSLTPSHIITREENSLSWVDQRGSLDTTVKRINPIRNQPLIFWYPATAKSLLFIHSVDCLITGPLPFPKQVLHIVRSKTASFNFQYPLFPLLSSSSCLHLHPRLPFTSSLYLSFNNVL